MLLNKLLKNGLTYFNIVATLIDNQIPGIPPVRSKIRKTFKINERLKSKEGR